MQNALLDVSSSLKLRYFLWTVKGAYNQGIKARISVSKVIRPWLNFRFFKTAWIPNQTDCQETCAPTSRHGATPQWRHSKWLTATTRPRTLGLLDVNSIYDIRKTCCRSISAEIRLCWHWILCFLKTHHVKNARIKVCNLFLNTGISSFQLIEYYFWSLLS